MQQKKMPGVEWRDLAKVQIMQSEVKGEGRRKSTEHVSVERTEDGFLLINKIRRETL